MRTFLAALFLIVLSGAALAGQALPLNKMSADQLQQYFAGKTAMHYDRRGGTAIAYFRSNGSLYLLGTGSSRVEKSRWTIVTEPGKSILCLAEASGRVPGVRGAKVLVRVCVDVKQFVREAIGIEQGDIFGISKRTKAPFILDGKKTTIAKLKAAHP